MDFLEKIDRQKLQRITLIVISALTLLAVVLLLIIIIASVEGGTKPHNDINDPAVEKNLDDISFEDTTVSEDVLFTGSLILANTEHEYILPASVNLVNIATYRNEHNTSDVKFPYSVADIHKFHLAPEAIEYAHKMLMQLLADTGNDYIKISSACGNPNDQTSSDVHTGYSIVLTVADAINPYLSDESNKVLADWLNANAYKFGFVVRYPADKADITGVSDYTHAFRYVGVAHATFMKENNLCLEEYIAYLKENTSNKSMLTLKTEDGAVYAAYYAPCKNAQDTVKVPVMSPNPDGSQKYSYTVSGTNEGGVVITVKVN